jgi:transcriptional regulator
MPAFFYSFAYMCPPLESEMFQPPVFREDRTEVMDELIAAHPFSTVVSSATGDLTADHVPLVLKQDAEGKRLEGHIASANPLFRETSGALDVLAVFQGPQIHVTPSWYASKQEHGKVVPTWNYVVVHVRGQLQFTRDTSWLLQHLADLTDQHESHRAEPWAIDDAPRDFIERQLRALVGFEIAIEDMQGTWKESQNKALKDWTGVKSGLESSESPDAVEIAQLIEERARR